MDIQQSKDKKREEQIKLAALKQGRSLEQTIFTSFKSLVAVLEGDKSKGQAIGLIADALDKLEKQTGDNVSDVALIKSGLETLEKELKAIPTGSLKQLPKFLEQREEIKVTNLQQLEKTAESIESAIKGLKLNVEAPKVTLPAPKVTLPAPVVNVDPVDLEPIKKPILDLLTAFKAFKIPESKPTDVSKVEEKLDQANKHLKKLVDKPVGGGGGGGGGSLPYVTSTGAASHVTLTPDGSVPTASKPVDVRFDKTSEENVTYIGKAELGASTGASVWQIIRIDKTADTVIQYANDSAEFTHEWDERVTYF